MLDLHLYRKLKSKELSTKGNFLEIQKYIKDHLASVIGIFQKYYQEQLENWKQRIFNKCEGLLSRLQILQVYTKNIEAQTYLQEIIERLQQSRQKLKDSFMESNNFTLALLEQNFFSEELACFFRSLKEI